MSLRQHDLASRLRRADQLLGAGRWRDAAEAYRGALAGKAALPTAWFNLGYALRRLGSFEEALDAYGMSLRHGVAAPHEVHLNRAAILADHLRRDEHAETELRAALALAPDYAPAWLNLGNLHEERGRREDAIACYRRIVSLSAGPAQVEAVEAIARLSHLDPPASPDDPILARLRAAAVSSEDIGNGLRATLLFALGRAYDALDMPAEAFDAFERANLHAHRDHPQYDPQRAEQLTRALMETARPAEADGTAIADGGPEPLFICGMFRSGSTLLEQVLAMHPAVSAGGELDLLPRMAAGPLAPFPASLQSLDAGQAAILATDYLASLCRRTATGADGCRYVTDKRPDNYRLVGLIKRLFPRARIINTVRHPLDVALSVFMQHLNPRAFGYAGSIDAIGHHYLMYRKLTAHWHALYPGDVYDFDYDAFVARSESTLRGLLDFLGLPWHAECLDFHRLGNTVKTASYWQVRRPLYPDASGRWRKYRLQLAPLAARLQQQGIALPGG